MASLADLIPEIAAYQQSQNQGQRQASGQLAQLMQMAQLQQQPLRNQLLQAQVSEHQQAPELRRMALESASQDRNAMREQRLQELTQRGEQEIARVREAAAQQRITKAEADAREASMRENMARIAAALRPAPPPRAPVAVMGPNNKPMFVDPADAIGKQPAVRETAERVVPQNIAKAYQENSTALRKIDTALSEVDKYPEAFGLQNVRGDAISQRVDPKGVTARAIVADIGSLKIHDRSGAAVTAAETPRLLPFIPNVNDRPEVVKKKLALFRKEYEAIQNDIGSMYNAEQGYKSLPTAQTRSTDKPVNPVDALLEKYK